MSILPDFRVSEPLDPDVSSLKPGITYSTSQLSWAWLMYFFSKTPRLEKWSRRYNNVHPQFVYLIAEVFGRLFQNQTPERAAPESIISQLCTVIHELLNEQTSMPSLMVKCDGDPLTARLALMTLLDAIDDLNLPGSDQPDEDPFDGQESSNDSGEQDKEQSGQQDQAGTPQPDYQALQDWIDNHNSSAEARAASRKAIGDGADQADKETKEHKQACSNAFGSGSGDMFGGDPEGALEFQDALKDNHRLKELIDLLGRWKDSISKASEDHLVPAPTVPRGIAQTKRAKDLTPAARAMLSDPDLEDMMLAKLVAGRAPGYDRGEMEGQEQGGVYVLIDASGSMGSVRMRQAAAMAAAVSLMCRDAKREARMAVFNTGVVALPCELDSVSDVTATLRTLSALSAGGGTDFNPALQSFLSMDDDFKQKSDIVLISDGYGPLEPDILNAVLQQASITYVVVDGGQVHPLLVEHSTQVSFCDLVSPDAGTRETSRALASAVGGLNR